MCFWFFSQSQDATTSSTSHPGLALFPDSKSIRDHLPLTSVAFVLWVIYSIAPWFWLKALSLWLSVLSVQVPSDPDEPFFILSLTEIPVCSSGEVVDSVSEPLSYLPAADASAQQQRLVLPFISPSCRRGSAFVPCLTVQLSSPQHCSWRGFGNSERWGSL